MQTPKSLHITYAGATAGILVCLWWYKELLFIRWIGRGAMTIIVPLLKLNSFDDLIVATLSLTPVLKRSFHMCNETSEQMRCPVGSPKPCGPIFSSWQVLLVKWYLSHVLYLLKDKQTTEIESVSSLSGQCLLVNEEVPGSLVGNKIRTQVLYSSFQHPWHIERIIIPSSLFSPGQWRRKL